MSFTVMGDTVNLASRLEGANKVYNSRLLVSEATASAAAVDVEVREIDRIVVGGQTTPQAMFEVMGRKGALTPAQRAATRPPRRRLARSNRADSLSSASRCSRPKG